MANAYYINSLMRQ